MKEHKIFPKIFPDGSKVSYRDIEQLLKENEKLKEENHYLNRRVKGEIHLGNCYKKDFAEEATRAEIYKQALEEIREKCTAYAKTEDYIISETFSEFLEIVFNKANEVLK